MNYTPKLAIVLPCYNEEEALGQSVPVLTEILDRLKHDGVIAEDSYVMCVNDGSRDKTWEVIKRLNSANRSIKGISLAHNRGHQYALLAGLMHVKDSCDAAISIDADLQDDPGAIVEMARLFRDGYEIVYGVRNSRATDTWFKRNSARAFYRLQAAMGLETVYDHADYRLMSRRALDILSQYGEYNLFLRGIVAQIGLKTTTVTYDRNPRVAGESKYPLSKMLSFSIDGITSFSVKPMRLIFMTGAVLFAVSILVGIYILGSYFFGETVSGWSSIMLSLWIIGSITLISLGIIGEYIGKIFNETKHRPRYNISDEV